MATLTAAPHEAPSFGPETAGLVALDAGRRVVWANAWLRARWRGALDIGAPFEEPSTWTLSKRLRRAIDDCLERRLPAKLSHHLNGAPLPIASADPDPDPDAPAPPQSLALRPVTLGSEPAEIGCLIEVRDVSVETAREAALRAKIVELSRANADLNLFISAASHDLRSPIRRMKMMAQLAAQNVADAQVGRPSAPMAAELSEAAERMEWVVRSAAIMGDLLRDLLAFCRLGADACEVVRADAGAALADLLRVDPPPSGFTVAAAGPLPVIDATPTEISLILRNLVSNALRHHDRDVGCVVVSGGVSDAESWITVSDDGPGVAPAYAPKVFDPFFRASDAAGSGLGLAMIKRIADARHGAAELRSPVADGRGAAVTVRFPKIANASERAPTSTADAPLE